MEKFNKTMKDKSMKKLLFLSLLIAGTLSAQTVDPYALTKVTAQNEIFFTLSPAEKLARMDNVQLVYEVPEGALLLPEKAVNHHRGVVMPAGYTLRDLYDERCALYEQYADVIIDESRTDNIGDVLDSLCNHFERETE